MFGPDGGLDDPSASAFRHVVEGQPELVIAIAQENRRSFAVHGGMTQLLGYRRESSPSGTSVPVR